VRLTPPIQMPLEKALAYIEDDELVEVTRSHPAAQEVPFDANDRKRAEKDQASGGAKEEANGE